MTSVRMNYLLTANDRLEMTDILLTNHYLIQGKSSNIMAVVLR